MTWVLGVDSGGSGLRVGLGTAGRTEPVASALAPEPVRTGSGGIDAAHLLDLVLPVARGLLAGAGAGSGGGVDAVAVGAAGMATLGADLRAVLPGALRAALGVRKLALAADAVTAYAGALGQHPGAVVAAGTGMIALGTDLTGWRRADGWGHLLGDSGSGAWIGRAGLDAAMRAYDGRSGGSAALLARMEAVFGPAPDMPGLLYPRTDRAAVLASFAPEVARCAEGDPVAAGILGVAAEHIADAAAAACPVSDAPRVALTGGLFRIGEALLGPVRRQLAARAGHAVVVDAAGDPLAGAVLLASAVSAGSLVLPHDRRLLSVH